jgi:hypothetical protein
VKSLKFRFFFEKKSVLASIRLDFPIDFLSLQNVVAVSIFSPNESIVHVCYESGCRRCCSSDHALEMVYHYLQYCLLLET